MPDSQRTQPCNLVRERIQILGHTLNNGKSSPSDDYVEVRKQPTAINSMRKLASFLGLVNYYRNHIKSFSEIAFSLTELLKNKVSENIVPLWKDIHENAFQVFRQI